MQQHGIEKLEQNAHSNIKKVIGVVSGKGGVGKSLVTSLMADAANRAGYQAGILDADITGPSIPRIFGLKGRAMTSQYGILPMESEKGIRIMSLNLLLDHDTDPVVWRGPIIANAVRQFWTDVVWEEVDYLFVDMPPGTGDVPLTVFQSLPVDGIIVVTSPQELVSMIVQKSVQMAQMMAIPVLGVVENYSYFLCPDNGKKYEIFGESQVDSVAYAYDIPVLAKLPIDPEIAKKCDSGDLENMEENPFYDAKNNKFKLVDYLKKK